MSNDEDYGEQEDVEHSNVAVAWLLVAIIIVCLSVGLILRSQSTWIL